MGVQTRTPCRAAPKSDRSWPHSNTLGGRGACQAAGGDTATPLTLAWLLDWHAAVLAKVTLYFYSTLSDVDGDMTKRVAEAHVPDHAASCVCGPDARRARRLHTGWLTPAIRGEAPRSCAVRLIAFQHATEAQLVCLLHHVSSPDFHDSGYGPPGREPVPLTGVGAFPVVFGSPEVRGRWATACATCGVPSTARARARPRAGAGTGRS